MSPGGNAFSMHHYLPVLMSLLSSFGRYATDPVVQQADLAQAAPEQAAAELQPDLSDESDTSSDTD